jgi:hypothetical protein
MAADDTSALVAFDGQPALPRRVFASEAAQPERPVPVINMSQTRVKSLPGRAMAGDHRYSTLAGAAFVAGRVRGPGKR